MTTPERWQQIKNVFNLALEYEPAQRPSFLSKACDNDEALQKEVESLLAAHEKDGSFIDSPVFKSMVDHEPELKPGQLVGSYEITSFLGRGGMGEVYVAHDKRLGRKVALKLVLSSVTKDGSHVQRFEQEARAASALNHPNIIAIYEICEVNSRLMIAAEFVEGETLRQRLSSGALSLNEVLNISIQIADALSAAHKAGIVHRDIKPENVMIRPDGYVKILDFGLAKLAAAESGESFAEAFAQQIETGTGVVIGTVGYMSPEQARGQEVDARSDIFNLGALIYEMLAGQKPFKGETPSDTFAAILKTDPPSLSQVAPEAPAELVRIVNKALRKDREERFQVVKDLLLDLKALKEELEFQARLNRRADTDENKLRVSTIDSSLNTQSNPHRAGTIAAVGFLTLLVIAGGIALYKFLGNQPAQALRSVKMTQVTFSSGLDVFPSLSPDGKSVAYSSDQTGNFEIYVKQLSPGGGELPITSDGQDNLQPTWSPDGQRIAYHSKKRGGIWLVSALGGTPRQLTETGSRPVWSPDGSSIAFQSGFVAEVYTARALSPSTISIVPAQGGTPKQISQPGNPAGGHSSPSWSSDGKRIAFEVNNYISAAVWSMSVAGGDQKKIVDGGEPVYAADGRYIYFTTGHNGGGQLSSIQISPAGDPIGKPTVVLEPGAGTMLAAPAISHDGNRILYSANRIVSNLWSVPLAANGDAAGSPSVFSSDTSQRNSIPRFTPDGSKVALNRWRSGTSSDIWVADADGKNLKQLTNNTSLDSQASWLPNNDRIAFLTDRDGKYPKLWTASLLTGKEEMLLDLGEGVEFATLSPDGTQVAYNFIHNGIMNVWVAGISDGQPRQLTFESEMGGFPCWSPDGKTIAFEAKRGEDDYLMLISSSGGPQTQLTFAKGKSWPHSFSPKGDRVVFAGQRDGVWNLYSISIDGKAQKQLTNYSKLNAFVRYPASSTNQVVYEYAETTGNIWMLDLTPQKSNRQ